MNFFFNEQTQKQSNSISKINYVSFVFHKTALSVKNPFWGHIL